MRRRSLKLTALLGILGSGLLIYACTAGPLFAWSPVKPGYDQQAFARAGVAWAHALPLMPEYSAIEREIDDTERLHRLKFRNRLSVVACRNWPDFHRFVPWVGGTSVGAVTLDTGTAVYVTPKVREMGFDTAEFLRHELSHAILLQNAPWTSRIHFKQVPWLYEGIAVLNGRQRAYGTAADFARRAQTSDLAALFSSSPYNSPGFDVRLAYRAWRYFLEDRIAARGRDRFQQLIESFMNQPTSTESSFRNIYGEDLRTAVSAFQQKIRNGGWQPETDR